MTTVAGTKLARHARKTQLLSAKAARRDSVIHLASLRAQSRAPMGTTIANVSLRAKLPAVKPGRFQRRIAPGVTTRTRFTGHLRSAKPVPQEKVPK